MDRRRLRGAATLAGAVLGASIAVALAGNVQATIGPFDTTLSARPSLTGDSTLELAPLGSIELDTHAGPVGIVLRVDELRPDEAERIARNPALLEEVEDDIAADAKRALLALLGRVLVVGAVGGGLGALVARRRLTAAVAGIGVGAVVAGGIAAVCALTFRAEAVAEPRYTGLLATAPNAVGDVEAIIERFDDYRAQLTKLVANVATLYEAGRSLPDLDPGADTVRVLHVSDLHNNPQAFDLTEELVAQFDLDAVLDTGDMTDWGTEPEGRLVDQIADLDVPYVWVRGNHDSRRTQAAVAGQPNAVVLDGDVADVAGLRLWGIGDPRYTPNKDQPTGKDEERDRADAFADDVARKLQRARGVDVVLVHDARIAAGIGTRTPLVLSGHTHKPRQGEIDDAVLLVEGSTGGAGLRGLQGEDPHPLTASVLYFDDRTDRLLAYDRITVDGLGGAGVRIERHILDRERAADAERPGRNPFRNPAASGVSLYGCAYIRYCVCLPRASRDRCPRGDR
ncbi:MAG: metallophosphoesterase [Acidimicrobiales bacterium]|nr:metallophosphoesterase [Acidimicrobiales bacterium]